MLLFPVGHGRLLICASLPLDAHFFLTLFLVCFEILTDSQDMTNPVRTGPRIVHPDSPNSPVTSYVTAV